MSGGAEESVDAVHRLEFWRADHAADSLWLEPASITPKRWRSAIALCLRHGQISWQSLSIERICGRSGAHTCHAPLGWWWLHAVSSGPIGQLGPHHGTKVHFLRNDFGYLGDLCSDPLQDPERISEWRRAGAARCRYASPCFRSCWYAGSRWKCCSWGPCFWAQDSAWLEGVQAFGKQRLAA